MKKQAVVGALRTQGNLVKNPSVGGQTLAAHWRPVFSAVPFDVDVAKQVLQQVVQDHTWDWNS
eukprot:10735767-Karenia_brevis.AAC.1